MANIIVSNQKFFNQLKNGVAFADNLSDFTINLVGTVGNRIRYTYDAEIGWSFSATPQNNLIVSSNEKMWTRTTGSWITDGFSVGDTLESIYDLVNISTWRVDSISDLSLIVTNLSGPSYSDGSIFDQTNSKLSIYGTTLLTALIYKFGIINNNDSFNDFSNVTGNEQAFYCSGINASTWTDFIRLGAYSDWDSCNNAAFNKRIKYISTTNYYQKFSVEVDFIITPFYLEQWKQNLIDGTIPDELSNLESLKYVYQLEFRSVLSNPNTAKIATFDQQLGSVAYFNENYNGFVNNYSIDSCTYTDYATSLAVQSLNQSKKTYFKIVVKGTFAAGTKAAVYFMLAAEQLAYQNKTTDLEYNFVYDNAINTEGAVHVHGLNGILNNVEVAIVSGDLEITGYTYFSNVNQQLISNGNYILVAEVANDTLTTQTSDKVALIADYNIFSSGDIFGFCGVDEFREYAHPEEVSVAEGSSSRDLWNEDTNVLKWTFWLDKIYKATLNSLKLDVVAYNPTTGDWFSIEPNPYNFNLGQQIVLSNVQQINLSDLRNYPLRETDYFTKVLISNTVNDADFAYYEILIGQKVQWKDWINNLNANINFYPNRNFKTSNFSDLSGYEIRFMLLANCTGTDNGIDYLTQDFKFLSPKHHVNDYNQHGWTATISTHSVDGSINYQGTIRSDKNTLFRTVWVKNSAFRTGHNFWAKHLIETHENLSDKIYELSSFVDSVDENILIPTNGNALLSLVEDDGIFTVTTECIIDYTKIESNKNYKLSARIDDGIGSGMVEARLNEDGTVRITEEGQIRIVE